MKTYFSDTDYCYIILCKSMLFSQHGFTKLYT